MRKHIKKEDAATERIRRIKEEQRHQLNEKSNAKKAEALLRLQKHFENEYNRKMAIKNKMEHKLMEAEKRKIDMQNEYKLSKIMKNYNYFEERVRDAEKKYFQNIELYNIYECHERLRMKVI